MESLVRRKRTRDEVLPSEEDEQMDETSETPEEKLATENEVAAFLPPGLPKGFAAKILDAEAAMCAMIKLLRKSGMFEDLQALLQHRSEMRKALFTTIAMM